MPVIALKNLAKRAGISQEKAEAYWESAKKAVIDSGVSENDESFYAQVMGYVKQYLRKKLNEEGETLSGTSTADVATYVTPLRKPDGVGPYGFPCFHCRDDEEEPVSRWLDGKKRYGKWMDHINDEGIRQWARKNPYKSFYMKLKNGVHVKIR